MTYGIGPAGLGVATYVGCPVQDRYSVSASSADTCYPARRLTDRIPSLLWRPTSGATSSTITLSATGAAPAVQGVALVRHGMSGNAYVRFNNGAERAFVFGGTDVAWVMLSATVVSRIDIRLAAATSGIGEVLVWGESVVPPQNYVYGSSVGSNLVLRTYNTDVVQFERCVATRRRWVRQYACVDLPTVEAMMRLQTGRYVIFSPSGAVGGDAIYGTMTLSDAVEIAPDRYDLTVTIDEIPLRSANE